MTSGLQLLLRAGNEAVGKGGARFISFPSVPTVNAGGDVAFLAFFQSADAREVNMVKDNQGGRR